MNQNKKPNMLIIMADELRIDCLGAYGNREIKTPFIDALAADGVTYENSFCAAPLCTPSRYSFITGLYPHQHLGWGNYSTIPSGLDTFPKILKQRGYRTKAVGKMHYTPTYADVGFEQMELAEQNGPGRYDDDYHRYLKERNLIDFIDMMDEVKEFNPLAPESYWKNYRANESNLPEEHHSTTWIGQRALARLEQWDEEGNLLMVSFIKPHHPFDPPAPWSRMYEPERLTLLPGWTEHCPEHDLEKNKNYILSHANITVEALKKAMACYYGAISQIDFQVGKLIEQLKSKGLYDDTLIIFTGDHGDYMGYHHMLFKSGYMYDPLVKVPLIIKWPGNEHKGERRSELVNNVDIAPTVIAQSGAGKMIASMPGNNLAENANKPFVFAEQARGSQYMIRSANRKLIYVRERKKSMFFDLEKDPFELNNLYEDVAYQSEVQEYIGKLSDFLMFDTPAPNHVHEQAETIPGQWGSGRLEEIHQETKQWFEKKIKEILAKRE